MSKLRNQQPCIKDCKIFVAIRRVRTPECTVIYKIVYIHIVVGQYACSVSNLVFLFSLTELQNARGIMDVLAEMLTAIDPEKKEVKYSNCYDGMIQVHVFLLLIVELNHERLHGYRLVVTNYFLLFHFCDVYPITLI